MKGFIKIRKHLCPYEFPLGNFVKFLLHLCSEIIVHDIVKVLHQKIVYHHADVRGKEFRFLCAGVFGLAIFCDLFILEGEATEISFRAFAVFLDYISSLLNGGDGRRIS